MKFFNCVKTLVRHLALSIVALNLGEGRKSSIFSLGSRETFYMSLKFIHFFANLQPSFIYFTCILYHAMEDCKINETPTFVFYTA